MDKRDIDKTGNVTKYSQSANDARSSVYQNRQDWNKQKINKNNRSNIGSLLVPSLLSLFFGFVGGGLGYWVLSSNDTGNAIQGQTVVLQESELIADIAKEVSPSVVSITVETESVSSFFGNSFTQEGEGTGIILDEDGLILTNRHVIGENPTALRVFTDQGVEYDDVEVVGRDPFNDIAFIRIKGAKDLTPAKLGDSSTVRVGDKVIAIGNALGLYDNTVTAGIISGLGRPVVASDAEGNADSLSNLFQTDTAINPGNSGGPLVNVNGEVIGINTAVAVAENVGFSIPINDAKSGLTSINETGELIKPYLGVRYVTITDAVAEEQDLPVKRGVLVIESLTQPAVISGGPADKAGIVNGDIITKISNVEVDETNSLIALIGKQKVGDDIDLEIIRDGDTQTISVKLEAAPESL